MSLQCVAESEKSFILTQGEMEQARLMTRQLAFRGCEFASKELRGWHIRRAARGLARQLFETSCRAQVACERDPQLVPRFSLAPQHRGLLARAAVAKVAFETEALASFKVNSRFDAEIYSQRQEELSILKSLAYVLELPNRLPDSNMIPAV